MLCFQIITFPISLPGSKPGDLPQQQTVQIQVVNPGGGSGSGGGDKFLPLSLQQLQQCGATVSSAVYIYLKSLIYFCII